MKKKVKSGLWSDIEDKKLLDLVKSGLSQRLISIKLDRTERSIANRFHRLTHRADEKLVPDRPVPWYKTQGLKIGFLDIETSNLHANAGFMLSWCLKVRGEKTVRHGLITDDEIHNFSFDKRIMEELLEALDDIDIVVTYWGTGFDVPFIRSRAMVLGLCFPSYGSIYHFDLYYAVRSLLRLHRNSLDAATRFLNIEGKTHLDMEQWFSARVGDTKTLKYVLDHNKSDVEILEKLFDEIEPFRKWTRKSL